ncbi:MAG: trypsin-like serine protease, partial [Kofleriaceae bacterium]
MTLEIGYLILGCRAICTWAGGLLVSWKTSIARVTAPGSAGTGFLISPDLVVTAGHVLMPTPTTLPAHADVHVTLDDVDYPIASYVVHERWRTARDDGADMALIRLAKRAAPTPLDVEENFR